MADSPAVPLSRSVQELSKEMFVQEVAAGKPRTVWVRYFAVDDIVMLNMFGTLLVVNNFGIVGRHLPLLLQLASGQYYLARPGRVPCHH